MRNARSFAAGLAAAMSLLEGCGGQSADGPTGPVQPVPVQPVPAQPVPVATVTVSGLVPLKVGETVQLSAVPHDASGNVLSGRTVSWNSTVPSVASVSEAGLVAGVSPGAAIITATIEGKSASGSISIRSPAGIATLSLGYSRLTMALREVLTLESTARDSSGSIMVGVVPTWSSSDPAVLAVQSDGSLLAKATGSATISASIDGVTASATVAVISFASIFALANDVCALTSAGVMYCAGQQFGPRGRLVAADFRWTQVAENVNDGGTHTCGVTTQAKVMCWGSNVYGELGVGDLVKRDQPVVVQIPESATHVSAGIGHTCALTVSGNAYCWGDNSFGQLGDESTRSSSVPVRAATNEKFSGIAAAGNHTCGLTGGGSILCWGENGVGQLGRGTWSTTDAFPTPAPVKSGVRFTSISSYTSHPCALAGGAAYCWGGNTVFQTGQSTPEQCYSEHPCVTVPGAVSGGLTFDVVTSSDFGACGLTHSGAVYCWGMDAQSMLGSASVPACPVTGATGGCTSTPLAGPIGFKTLTGGLRNYCGIRSDGGAYCWGGNRFGQLGVASPDQTSIPLPFTIDPGVTPP